MTNKEFNNLILPHVGLVGGGAPRGRRAKNGPANGRIYDRLVRLNQGGYDRGGAYWGTGDPLRVRFTADGSLTEFYRGKRKSAN